MTMFGMATSQEQKSLFGSSEDLEEKYKHYISEIKINARSVVSFAMGSNAALYVQ